MYNLMDHTLLYLIKTLRHLHVPVGWTSILSDIVQELFHTCMERNKRNKASYVKQLCAQLQIPRCTCVMIMP